ncbi:hypothetical protein E3226_001090 [Legionella geestiana]|uniref:hypothetical protein n=1 Tax=Legionella geestiana TaxID=45065 RepID=UPI001091CE89|nr:hypothetical protein [Legionella geestiana]QDQ39099.1 hypothetical protein E3226_001090 [Legionella geestiana]
MSRNSQDMQRYIAMRSVREFLTAGHFFLPTKMRLMFSDWNEIDYEEKQSRRSFLEATLVSQTISQDLPGKSQEGSRSNIQETLITRESDNQFIKVITRAKSMYSGIFQENSTCTMASALKTDALQENLETLAALPENERKVAALFNKISYELLASKYPEGSDDYKRVEDELIKQKTSPDEDELRETYRNDTIWSEIDLDRCYDFVTTFYEAFSRLEEKIQKFETSDPDAAEAIRNMQDSLTQKIDAYVQGNLNNEEFYSQSMAILDDEHIRQPLEKHRGCGGFFGVLTRALSNFAAFFGFRTDSAKKLDALKEELAELTGHPSPEAQRTEEFFERLGNFDIEEDLTSRGPGRT